MDIDVIGIGADTRQVKNASKDLDKLGTSADKASRKADGLTNSTKGMNSSMSKLGDTFAGFKSVFTVTVAITALTGVLRRAAQEAKNFQQEQGQLQAVLRSTGMSAGWSANELNKMADQFARSTTYTSGEINKAQTRLLSYTGIVGKQFPDAMQAVVDMAARMGMSVEQSAETIGRALDIPSQGLNALQRQGFRFTESQKALVEQLEETGRVAEAQQIILDSLKNSYGGAAEAMNTGITKATSDLSKAWADLLKEIGSTETFQSTTTGFFSGVTNYLKQMKAVIESGDWLDKLTFFTSGYYFRDWDAVVKGFEGRQASGKIRSPDGQSERMQALAEADRQRTILDKEALKRADELKKLAGEQRIANIKAIEDRRKAEEERINNEFKVFKRAYEAQQEMLNANNEYARKLREEEQKEKIRNMEILQRQAKKNFDELQAENKRFEDERRREAERTADFLSRSISDGLMRGFENGLSFAENFKRTLINMFQTLILQPVINMIVNQSGITGIVNSISGALTGQGGGVGGLLGGFKNIIGSLNGSLVGSIESLGVFLTEGFGSVGKSLGGALGQYAGTISKVLPFLGAGLQLLSGDIKGAAFTGGGTAIGSLLGGPVGGAIGGAIGKVVGGLFGGKKQPPRTVTQLPQVASRFNETLQLLSEGFGLNSSVSSSASFRGRAGGSGYGQFGARINGQSIGGTTREGEYNEASLNRFIQRVLVGQTQRAIQLLDLPDGVKKFFDKITDADAVANAVNTLVSLNAQLKDLPPVFDAIRNAIDTTAYTTSIEALQAQFQATQNFVNLFYTEAERLDITFKQLNTQFGALNLAVPSSKDAFRALVESIQVTDEVTRNQFNGLISLAPTIAAYFDQLASGINEVNDALADALNKNLFSTYADFISAQANIAVGNSPAQFMANQPAISDPEIAQLRADNVDIKVILSQIAFNTKKTKDIQNAWNGDGLPEVRTY